MKYLKYVLHAIVILGVGVAAVRYLDVALILQALAQFTPLLVIMILIIPAVQLAIKAWRFVVFIRPLSDVSAGVPLRAYAAGQPATLLPGGIAARIGLMLQAGVPVGTSSAAVLFSSLFDQVVFFSGLALAAFLIPAVRGTALTIFGVALALALLILLAPVRRALGRGAHWLAARFGFEEGWDDFVRAVREELGPRVILAALVLSVLAFAADVWLLDLSLRGVGHTLPLQTLFLAYLLPTMLGRMSALPAGGIGVAEAGMIGYLVAFSSIEADTAAAAAAVFRIAAVFLQAVYGALVYLLFWRGEAEEEENPVVAEPDTTL